MDTERKSQIKKVAKNVGKAALTIVAHPIGLPTFFKNKRVGIALAGLVLDLGISVNLIDHERKIYDNPSIASSRGYSRPKIRNFAEFFLSPLALYLDTEPATRLIDGERKLTITGDDVVAFDKEEGRYFLNFDANRKFRTSEGNFVSLAEEQSKLEELTQKYQGLVAEGNIIDARASLSELETARRNYDGLADQLKQTHTAYESAVAKMNDEIKAMGLSSVLEAIEERK